MDTRLDPGHTMHEMRSGLSGGMDAETEMEQEGMRRTGG